MPLQALIVGATGAIGSELLNLCLDDARYARVTVIARRPATADHAKLNWIEADFDVLSEIAPIAGLAGGDAFCCLGTTIRAAGSKAAFRRVDFDYVVATARFAGKCEMTHFAMVSALGADSRSGIFYNRTKGDVEAAVLERGFPSLHIFRPSLLTGERAGFRLKEAVGKWLLLPMTPLLVFGLRKFRPIAIARVARAMYACAGDDRMTGAPRIYESDELQRRF